MAAEVASFAYRAGDASARCASSPLERAPQDVHAATQHVSASEDAHLFAGDACFGRAASHPLLSPRAPRA